MYKEGHDRHLPRHLGFEVTTLKVQDVTSWMHVGGAIMLRVTDRLRKVPETRLRGSAAAVRTTTRKLTARRLALLPLKSCFEKPLTMHCSC